MNIGKNLKRLREDKNLTLEELGQKVGVSRQHLSYIEQDLKNPSVPLLKRLANVLETTMDKLTA